MARPSRSAAALILSLAAAAAQAAPPAAPLARIEVSFKLDARLTRSLYLGDRWVSPATFRAPPQARPAVVRASARGVDTRGRPLAIAPRWIAADPEMVEVTEGAEGVSITVKRAGESKLRVAFRGITRELTVRAASRGESLAVEIAR